MFRLFAGSALSALFYPVMPILHGDLPPLAIDLFAGFVSGLFFICVFAYGLAILICTYLLAKMPREIMAPTLGALGVAILCLYFTRNQIDPEHFVRKSWFALSSIFDTFWIALFLIEQAFRSK